MASHSMFIFGSFLLILGFTGTLILAETGCPPAETIAPCTCDNQASPRLWCSNVTETSIVETVFQNARRYTFQEVHFKSVVLQYLPTMIFDEIRINELYIENSRLIYLFSGRPVITTLEKLQLDNTTLLRGKFYEYDMLKKMTSLKTLVLNNVPESTLDFRLSPMLPSSLKQITLRGTGLKEIYPGAFRDLTNLDKLEISYNGLKNITREMFPRPFNVRFLYFDNINMSYIPRDLFTDMPNLQFVSLRDNYLTGLPEAAFGNRQSSIPYVRLDGNPLQCNCLLVWLIKNKPEIIGGQCNTPRYLLGKQLKNLQPGDFNC